MGVSFTILLKSSASAMGKSLLGVLHDCPTMVFIFFLSKNDFEVVGDAVQSMSRFSVAVWARETNGHHLKTRWAVAEDDDALNDLEGRIV